MDSLSTGTSDLVLQCLNDPSNQTLTINTDTYQLTGQSFSGGQVVNVEATITLTADGPLIECDSTGLMVNDKQSNLSLIHI